MAITESQLQKVQEIFLEEARAHFPSEVKFTEARTSLYESRYGDECLQVELLYLSAEQLLDPRLTYTFHRRTDQPTRDAGFTGIYSVRYIAADDPTRPELREGALPQ